MLRGQINECGDMKRASLEMGDKEGEGHRD